MDGMGMGWINMNVTWKDGIQGVGVGGLDETTRRDDGDGLVGWD